MAKKRPSTSNVAECSFMFYDRGVRTYRFSSPGRMDAGRPLVFTCCKDGFMRVTDGGKESIDQFPGVHTKTDFVKYVLNRLKKMEVEEI